MESTRVLLEKFGQEHLLQFWCDLSESEKEVLLNDIQEIDIEKVTGYFRKAIDSPTDEKLDALLQPVTDDVFGSVGHSSSEELLNLKNVGLQQISEGKVGVLLFAGGQGTRLAHQHPKGTFNAGLPSQKSLFQIQAERIFKLETMAREKFDRPCAITWYIMTSGTTMEKTAKFFDKNNYFGLNKENIVMFEQGMMPCFTLEGKIILDEKHRLSRSPDGNGDLYRSLRDRGVLAHMTQRGVKYLNAHSVDNILVKVADPVFIGFCVQKGSDCGVKVIEKTILTEPLGVVCSVNGVFHIVEYNEMKPATVARTLTNGRLTFRAGSICNHFFTTKFLSNIAHNHESTMKYHIAHKQIPFINDAGERIIPDQPNGIKIEKFVLDMSVHANNLVVWEVPREEEFSPIKTKEGGGKDNPKTAREAVNTLHRLYIERAGGKIEGDGLVEISPLLSYGGEGLEGVVDGQVLRTPILLSAAGEKQQNDLNGNNLT